MGYEIAAKGINRGPGPQQTNADVIALMQRQPILVPSDVADRVSLLNFPHVGGRLT